MRGGLNAHQAAERYGIATATAVRWRSQDLAGRSDPLPVGGGRRSGRIEAQADFLLGVVEEQDDITLVEMQQFLSDARGLQLGIYTLWRFFDRRGVTWTKGRLRRRAGPAQRSEAA